jgi:hypothetical protein
MRYPTNIVKSFQRTWLTLNNVQAKKQDASPLEV